jgi:hypothetical protein
MRMKTIVIRARLTSLTCAKVLTERSAEVAVFEALDDVSGRVRAGEKDNFLLATGEVLDS